MSDSWLGLEGKQVIVTGGASGIGRHVVAGLRRAGAHVACFDLTVADGVDAETGARTEVAAGSTADALYYEMLDMEHAVQTRDASAMCLGYSRDVMDIMTRLRKEWGMKYPGEEWD